MVSPGTGARWRTVVSSRQRRPTYLRAPAGAKVATPPDQKRGRLMAIIDVDGALIEHQWFYPNNAPVRASDRAPMVFLHHGFGCVADWKDFPQRVADALGRSGLVFSRRNCGASSAVAGDRSAAYLHQEACEFLPRL